MKFSINAYKYLLGLDDSYRLCKDGTWKQQRDFKQFDEHQDMLFSSYKQAESWLAANKGILINGELANTEDPDETGLMRTVFSFEIVAHRTEPPANRVFTKEQVSAALAAGNDQHHNSLIVDYDGTVRLFPLTNRSSLAEYPVRYETFGAGNGYVGDMNQSDYLDTVYLALLEGWWLHMDTGRSFYRDYVSGEHTESELVLMLKEY